MALKLKMRGDVVSDLASRSPSTLTPSPVDVQMGAPVESSPGASRFKPMAAAVPSSTSERARYEIGERAAERQRAEARARRKKVSRMLLFIVVLLAVAGGVLWYFGWVQWRGGRLVFNLGEGGRDAAVENSAEPTTLGGKMGQFLTQNLQQTGNDISASVKESAPAAKLDGVAGKIENALSGVTATIAEAVRPEAKAKPGAANVRMRGAALRLEGLFVDKNGARLARINGQMLKTGAEFAGLKIVLITDKNITIFDGEGMRRVKIGGWLQ